MIRILTLAYFLIALPELCLSQKKENFKTDSIVIIEGELKTLGRQILKGKTDSVRIQANEKFSKLLSKALQREDALNYSFDSLTNVSKLSSPDHQFKIYTWVLPNTEGTHFRYFGFIQQYNKEGFFFNRKYTPGNFIILKDRIEEIPDPENSKLSPEKWYGALYYKILLNRYKGKSYYTLLGWRGTNRKTTKKIIDNFILSKNKIVFGQPIFKDDKLTRNRVIFEYSAQVSMSLKFEENVKVSERISKSGKKKKIIEKFGKLIVFDRLVPSSPNFEGQKEFYGPALKYDGYIFEKGKWLLKQDVDVRNPLPPKSKHQVIRITEPRPQPKRN